MILNGDSTEVVEILQTWRDYEGTPKEDDAKRLRKMYEEGVTPSNSAEMRKLLRHIGISVD